MTPHAAAPVPGRARPSETEIHRAVGHPTLLRDLACLEHAFQPIVNIHTGVCFGYEALLRGVDRIGYASVPDFYDALHAGKLLAFADGTLREKAIARFARIPHAGQAKLFLNLDKRIFDQTGHHSADPYAAVVDGLAVELERHGIHGAALSLELTERQELHSLEARRTLGRALKARFKLALDDFGTGISGLQLLYQADPDFIKIDRFFISDIPTDSRKRLFVSHMVNMAHALGILVVAEGVESLREYYICRDIGCDLVQGYFVLRPTLDLGALLPVYPAVVEARAADRRAANVGDQRYILERMQAIEAVRWDTPLAGVLDRFARCPEAALFPVVNVLGEPIGVVRETDLKRIAYSQYGRDLVRNPSCGMALDRLVLPCPMADVNVRAERILDLFSRAQDAPGILIQRDMKYIGFLSARALLQVIHEKNLQEARDQNPLTRLPGNFMIHEYLDEAARDGESSYALVWIDFDHFKPFNDKYGFREGDRALLLFGEILQKEFRDPGRFTGHVGGDDFFVAFRDVPFDIAYEDVRRVLGRFRREVESFYGLEERRLGRVTAIDRDGRERTFPLLSASAAMVYWERDLPVTRRSVVELGHRIAELKKEAKSKGEGACVAALAGR